MSHRPLRVAEEIRKVISERLVRGVGVTLPGFVTISTVEINKDLTLAKIYYSVFGEGVDVREVQAALDSVKKQLRQEVGRQIRLRLVPELAFVYDNSMAHADRINQLLSGKKDPE